MLELRASRGHKRTATIEIEKLVEIYAVRIIKEEEELNLGRIYVSFVSSPLFPVDQRS